MESPQLALLLSRTATRHYAGSARPDAPVVDDHPRRRRPHAARGDAPDRTGPAPTRRVRLARPRATLASALHRAADALAPSCEPHGAAR